MDKRILIGTGEIMDYVGIKSKELLATLINKGMPARKIGKNWYAHKENIDAYFRRVTNVKRKKGETVDI